MPGWVLALRCIVLRRILPNRFIHTLRCMYTQYCYRAVRYDIRTPLCFPLLTIIRAAQFPRHVRLHGLIMPNLHSVRISRWRICQEHHRICDGVPALEFLLRSFLDPVLSNSAPRRLWPPHARLGEPAYPIRRSSRFNQAQPVTRGQLRHPAANHPSCSAIPPQRLPHHPSPRDAYSNHERKLRHPQ